jgi:hypothetical protein
MVSKKVTWEELSPIEKKWAEGWIEGICRLEASGPIGEPPSETEREYNHCMELFMEDKDKLAERARRWSGGLRAVLE